MSVKLDIPKWVLVMREITSETNVEDVNFSAIGKKAGCTGAYVKKVFSELNSGKRTWEQFEAQNSRYIELKSKLKKPSEPNQQNTSLGAETTPETSTQVSQNPELDMDISALNTASLQMGGDVPPEFMQPQMPIEDRRKMPTPPNFQSQYAGVVAIVIDSFLQEFDDKLDENEKAQLKEFVRRVEFEQGGEGGAAFVADSRVLFGLLVLSMVANRKDKIKAGFATLRKLIEKRKEKRVKVAKDARDENSDNRESTIREE